MELVKWVVNKDTDINGMMHSIYRVKNVEFGGCWPCSQGKADSGLRDRRNGKEGLGWMRGWLDWKGSIGRCWRGRLGFRRTSVLIIGNG